jgi:hypothetical protein
VEFDIQELEVDSSKGVQIHYVTHPLFTKYGAECWEVRFINYNNRTIGYRDPKAFVDGDRFCFTSSIPTAEKILFTGKIDISLFEEIMNCEDGRLAYHLLSPNLTCRTLAKLRVNKK